jgi:hypothetical protein
MKENKDIMKKKILQKEKGNRLTSNGCSKNGSKTDSQGSSHVQKLLTRGTNSNR